MRDGLSNHIRWRWYRTGLEALGQPDCGCTTLEYLTPKIGDLAVRDQRTLPFLESLLRDIRLSTQEVVRGARSLGCSISRVRSQLGQEYSGASRFPKIGYRLRKLNDDVNPIVGGHFANHCTLFLFQVYFVYE